MLQGEYRLICDRCGGETSNHPTNGHDIKLLPRWLHVCLRTEPVEGDELLDRHIEVCPTCAEGILKACEPATAPSWHPPLAKPQLVR